jgi:hypothetical protein
MDVLEIVMSDPEVPTVKPDTITLPELSRSSAFAAVPVAEAVADKGTPERVKTPLETVPGVALNVTVAKTPVAPDKAEVPITSEPAVAEPVEDAAVLLAIKSATNCMRLFLRVVE